MSENVIDVEKKIEEVNDNVMEPIDNNAIDGQVELPADPTEPEVEPSDDELTKAEVAEFKEFEDEMADIIAEAIPEVTATLDPTTQLSENSERSVEIGGYNPEQEEGESKLLDEIVDASTPVTAEFVPDKIIDAADVILDAEPEEYTFNQNEVLVETEDDKVEDVTNKVDNLVSMQGDSIEAGDVKVSTEDGEKVSEMVSLESEIEEVSNLVEKLIDNMDSESDVTLDEVEIKDQDLAVDEVADNNGSFEDISENAQVGEIEISNIQVMTADGVDTQEVDITLPVIAETPLDEVETGEVIHLHTLDEADIEANIEAQVKEMIGSESEDIDLNLGIVDGNQVVEKGSDEEVIVGDFADIVMAVTAEANKDVDGECLEEFEITSTNPDEHVEIDETKSIEDHDDGPIAGDFDGDDDDYSDAFDSFINEEYDDISTGEIY